MLGSARPLLDGARVGARESRTEVASRAAGPGSHVAVVHSGVHAAHPHVNGVAGGFGFCRDGREQADYIDRLGTARRSGRREGAAPTPMVRRENIFDESLAARRPLPQAIDGRRGTRGRVNLSLGTSTPNTNGSGGGGPPPAGAVVAAGEDAGVGWAAGG